MPGIGDQAQHLSGGPQSGRTVLGGEAYRAVLGLHPIRIYPANRADEFTRHGRRGHAPVTTGKPVDDTAVLPVALGWVPQRDPHGREDGVVATRHTHVMPALLRHESGRLVVLKGNG